MKLHETETELDETTGRVLKAFFRVYNTLGWGFLEVVYRRSMARVLRRAGATVIEEAPQAVVFEGETVGEYRADLLVDRAVIVELKAVDRLCPEHRAQVINYLRASNIERGLLLNFGPTPEIKRIVYANARKSHCSLPFP